MFLGLSAALAGKWLEDVGPRKVGTVAAACWGGGYLVGGLGIYLHELWLVYLGYGVIGGCGLGLGYVSPVSTLIRWFPDRRGMATGMAIMGFGGGAIIGAPLKRFFIRTFYEQPEYLGTVDQVSLVHCYAQNGRRRAVYLAAIIEEAREEDELAAFEPTPKNVDLLRDKHSHRWERIAVRVFGDPRRTREAMDLYDEAKGKEGAAQESYTGRGRRFPNMKP